MIHYSRMKAYLLLLLLSPLVILQVPSPADATTSSITITGTEGDITISAEAAFSSHEHCTDKNGEQICHQDSSGTMTMSLNTEKLASVGGKGSATWTKVMNSGRMRQGIQTFQARACDSKSICHTSSAQFEVDNTPVVTIQVSSFNGDMGVHGTADFTENSAGNAGAIQLIYDRHNDNAFIKEKGLKSIEGAEPVHWTWAEIAGSPMNAGGLAQGTHALVVKGIAANNTQSQERVVFNIDNTPSLTLTADIDEPEGDIHARGTVDFTNNLVGPEGSICIYYDRHADNAFLKDHGCKSFEGEGPFDWEWEEIWGKAINAGKLAQGKHALIANAIAANRASVKKTIVFQVDNTPEIEILGPRCYPDETFDILGIARFKSNLTGNEGSTAIYIKDINEHDHYYKQHGSALPVEGQEISWKYSDFTGYRLEKAVWAQREILVKAVAAAANGASAKAVKGMIIPALGCPTGF